MAVNRPIRVIVGAALLFLVAIVYLGRSGRRGSSGDGGVPLDVPMLAISRNRLAVDEQTVDLNDKAVIVASISGKDTSWVEEKLPDWTPYVYVADSQIAALHPERNKGNEANVYLQFIIDNYDALPATMVFLHHHEHAYHVDTMFATNADSVRALRLEHVQRVGYASMRCMDEPGCICAPMRHWDLRDDTLQAAWPDLFPGVRLPDLITAPCCAQFAVSRAQVRARPLADYRRLHAWLMANALQSSLSGRIFEHLWHVIFGRDAVHCEEERACYCEKFGICLAEGEELRTWNGDRGGFWPPDYEWLRGHKCAKVAARPQDQAERVEETASR